MKVKALTPKGKVILDLTVAKDIETFGGQDAVNKYIEDTCTRLLPEMPFIPSEPPEGYVREYMQVIDGKQTTLVRKKDVDGEPDIVEITRGV